MPVHHLSEFVMLAGATLRALHGAIDALEGAKSRAWSGNAGPLSHFLDIGHIRCLIKDILQTIESARKHVMPQRASFRFCLSFGLAQLLLNLRKS
ncbi:MAG: hypothetical protein ACLQIQ_10875 [Beijerinckiaceae bacterium]